MNSTSANTNRRRRARRLTVTGLAAIGTLLPLGAAVPAAGAAGAASVDPAVGTSRGASITNQLAPASSPASPASAASAAAARLRVWAPHVRRFIVPTHARSRGRQLATWYGPGLWGNGLGCGGTLRRSTWGIAHRTLPCGTLVGITYRGRRVAVRVIDRGPFSGATIDLTQRTSDYLHFTSRGTGHVRLSVISRYRY